MNKSRMAAAQAGLLFVAMCFAGICANAAVKKNTMRITVLDSETRSVSLDSNGVPNNCDQVTFDAYCRSSRGAPLVNTLLVQEGDRPPFRISCTTDSKFSRCMPLPKGESFDARREKHGIVVYYADDNGKPRKQMYSLVDAGAANPAATAPVVTQPAPAPAKNAGQAPAAAAPVAAQPVPESQKSAGSAPAATVTAAGSHDTVKCSFSSTPAGAEVSVDGKYVGSTPSVVGVGVGTHEVEVSLPGFAQWKRELTVSPGSELTVNAVLQKVQ